MDAANLYPHLSDIGRALIDAPDDERSRAIRTEIWIPYPRADEILERLEDLLNYPRVSRMPNMLIVGPTNNGKSSLLQHFCEKYKADENPDGEASIVPVIMIEAPSKPDEGEFYDRIFQAVKAPYKAVARVAEKCYQAKTLFGNLGVRMLIVDEIQHLIAGSLAKQREFRNALKSLGNETKVSIVAAGVEEAFNAFNTDPQLSNRFEPEMLDKWRMDNTYGGLLMSIERRTPLKCPSNLAEPTLAQKILWMSEGTIGEICRLVGTAAIKAIRTGEERITAKLLDEIRWTPPSKRKDKRPAR